MSISSLLNSHGLQSVGSPTVAGQQEEDETSNFASLFNALAPQAADSLPATKEPLSTNARLAAQQTLATSVKGKDGEPISVGSILEQTEAALKNWQEQLTGKLQEKGISLDEPLRLIVRPGDGKIVVQGDHPQKTEIEAILNEDPALANSIRAVSSMYDLLRAFERNKDFSRAYEQDPVAAVQQFGHLFDEQTNWPVEFRIDSYGAEVVS